MSTFAQRWSELPRAAKWGGGFIAFIALYFLAIEPAMKKMDSWNIEADKLAADLRTKTRIRQDTIDGQKLVEQATRVIGRPSLPVKTSDRTTSLDRRLSTIFGAHNVKQRTNTREPTPLASQLQQAEVPQSLVPPDSRLDKIVVELSFETDMATFTDILKEMEQAPEIACVTRVQIRKQQPTNARGNSKAGPVAITLFAEAWSISPAPNKNPAGARPRGDL